MEFPFTRLFARIRKITVNRLMERLHEIWPTYDNGRYDDNDGVMIMHRVKGDCGGSKITIRGRNFI